MGQVIVAALALLLVAFGTADAQGPAPDPPPIGELGTPNSFSLPAALANTPPFTNRPHPLNNPYRGNWVERRQAFVATFGTPVAQYYVAPTVVTLPTYVAAPGSTPGSFAATSVTVPGYLVIDTTTGQWRAPRWTVAQVTYGVYQWQWRDWEFFSR
jgi:hypothetical protein